MIIDKEQIHKIRESFFDSIIAIISEEPTKMDIFLDQQQYYVKPLEEEIYKNIAYGDLVVPVGGVFSNQSFKVWYSMWHIGERIKVGIMLKDVNLQEALISDHHKEINKVWGEDVQPSIDTTHGAILYEWEFSCPAFYDSYMYQEKFILGMRHMHFRVMKIVYDKFRSMHMNEQVIYDEEIKNLQNLQTLPT